MTAEPASTDPHPNVGTYLKAIEAFNQGDLDAVRAYVQPDVVYRIPGESMIGGVYYGIDEFAEILQRLRHLTDDSLSVTASVLLADDDNLIARAHLTARRGLRKLDTEHVFAFRFVDGKIAEGQVFVSDSAQLDAFWR